MERQEKQSVSRPMYLGGECVQSDSVIEVFSPFNGQKLASVSVANADLVERSIDAAVAAAEKMRL
ncbi:hypothetical protein OFB92_32765, partial [Escherichia coli]|nr:hypothetical protein [Escherichia coli]